MHAVNTQHGLQRIGPSAIARLGIKRLDDSGHILPWQNLLHAGEENLFSGLTALSAEFTIGLMMSLWDALRMNMMISYQELVRTFPSYVYDIGPFILNNDLCFSMKDNDKNYCDGILNSALYLERRNDGIILLDGVKYIYFVQPLRDNIQLVFLVDATHYVTLVKKQYPFGIFLSMDVFTQGRSIYSDNIGQSLVFPVTAFTSGLNYLPELTYVFGFSKRIFLLVC
ncbi:TPA: hypothetical protein ACNTVS_004557, partial [Escherichia coli]